MSPSSLLAIVADIYTPLLGVIYLRRLLQAERATRLALFGALLLNLAIAWGWMLTDHFWAIWPAWSLDYSTHTAVALAFIVCLCFSIPKQSALWITFLAGYAALMVVLDYHSMGDIVTTVLVAGPLMFPVSAWCYRKFRSPYPPNP